MFNKKAKDEALQIHKRAVDRYNFSYLDMNDSCDKNYTVKQNSKIAVVKVEMLINSIANKPKKFEKEINDIKLNREEFESTEKFAKEAEESAVKAGINAGLGVGGGIAFAAAAPNALMKYAMLFGKTSSGKLIRELNGIAAKKAALAFLGGGAKAAGGAGVAGGVKLLALMGVIGYAIGGINAVYGFYKHNKKNGKIADDVVEAAREISEKSYELKELNEKIKEMTNENSSIYENVVKQYDEMEKYSHVDYRLLDDDEKISLGILVNNTLSLSEVMNKTIE